MPTLQFTDIYTELVVLLLIAAVAGVVANRLRQPLIIGFIAVGILMGPAGLKLIRSTDEIHVFAEMGLALLLFVVGLKLDLQLIRKMGKVALATGIGQVVFTTLGGFGIALALKFPLVSALYIAIALTFSSTIIVVKLLSDKRETESLHGRISLGMLIVQDIVVVLAMISISAFSAKTSLSPMVQILLILLKGMGLFAAVWVASYLLLPRMLPIIARSTELLVLFGIAWALILALLGESLGISKEVGAFVAGISLASTQYRDILCAKLVSLRDFLLLFFFLEMGSGLNIAAIGSQVLVAIPLALFVLIGNPVIVMLVMKYLGYRKRTSFMTGLTMAQISEFSLILIAMGAASGQIGENVVGVVTLVGLITIALSTYMIIFAQPLYERCSPYLSFFERKDAHREDTSAITMDPNGVILIGLGSYGGNVGQHLLARGRTVLGVDFDPQAVDRWNAQGGRAVFGDAGDPEFAHALPLLSARWVISSIRDPQINTAIVHAVRHAGYSGNIAFAAVDRDGVSAPMTAGANLVFIPFEDAAEQAVDLIFNTEAQLERTAMDKQIEALTDHYVICGFGRMGQQIVKDLTRQQVPFVVVEDNPEQLPKLQERRIPHVVGIASDDDILLRSGISRAKGLIAVASSDEANVFIVLTGRVLNPKLYIVARSILEENEDKLRRAGADRVMSPYTLGGRRMAAAITKPGIMDFLDLVVHSDTLDIEIGCIPVPTGSEYIGRTLREVGLGQTYGVTLLAVLRPGEELYANPRAEFEIREGDELLVMGSAAQLATFGKISTPALTG